MHIIDILHRQLCTLFFEIVFANNKTLSSSVSNVKYSTGDEVNSHMQYLSTCTTELQNLRTAYLPI